MISCLYIIVGGLSNLTCQERRSESLQPLLLLFLLAELTMESKFVVLAYHVKRCCPIPSNITHWWYIARGILLLHMGSFLVNIIIPGHPGFDRFRALGSLQFFVDKSLVVYV